MSAAGNQTEAARAAFRLPGREYCYDTLAASQFRLFKIAAYDGTVPSGLLETYDMNACPQFRALSYTWGPALDPIAEEQDRINTMFIIRNGKQLDVTKNAFDACLYLSNSDIYQNQHFWIDAICINQGDLQERARQVLLMGEIYSNALEVVIWLGWPTVDLGNIVWATEVLLPKLDEISPPPGIGAGRLLRSSVFDPEIQKILGIERLAQKLRGFNQFCSSRTWFQRSWTFQEFALAGKIKVLCGLTELSLEELVRISGHLTLSYWGPQANAGSHLPSGAGSEPSRISTLQDIFRAARQGHIESEFRDYLSWMFAPRSEIGYFICWLFSLVLGIRDLKSTDRRDKIYCLLGLADRGFPDQQHAGGIRNRPTDHVEDDVPGASVDGRPGKIEAYVKPDYALDVSQVYLDFTKLVLEHSQRLSLLSWVSTLR